MNLIVLVLFQFLLRYRRAVLGPLWLLLSPALFVGLLGVLYAEIGSVDTKVFIPHLAVGLTVWTVVSGFITGSATLFQRARAQILQGGQSLKQIVAGELITNLLIMAHQIPILLVVFFVYGTIFSAYSMVSIVGLALIVANGYWFALLFGILGVRYRDIAEIFQAVMRIVFLATPIIWMPSKDGRGGVMGHFLELNPFYHFVEVVRAPLLGQSVSTTTWIVVLGITVVGLAISALFEARYSRFVPLWV